MSTTPRPWSVHEDALLRNAVAQHGDGPGVWKLVSDAVPGRSNKACRKRWLHSLSPTVRKTPWTPAEDALLLKLYATHTPARWSLIAKHIPGRTDDACSKRYREALDPMLKKDSWTSEEDAKLVQLTAELGSKWTQVGHAMGRSGLGCRNRWRLLQRKQHPRNAARPASTQDADPGLESPQNAQYRSPGLGCPPSPAHQCPAELTTSSVPVSSSPPCLIHCIRNSSDFVPISSDFISPPQSPPPPTCPIQVPASPPVHPGADPGSASVSPRKRPRLRSSPPSEHIRLSSRLPVDIDRSVLPYACGHPTCWPGSLARFATAAELAGHRRLTHPGINGKLFKCALQGCGKSWKVTLGSTSTQTMLMYAEHQRHTVSFADLQGPFQGRALSNPSASHIITCRDGKYLRFTYTQAKDVLLSPSRLYEQLQTAQWAAISSGTWSSCKRRSAKCDSSCLDAATQRPRRPGGSGSMTVHYFCTRHVGGI